MNKWECASCGYVYDPEQGDPEIGIEWPIQDPQLSEKDTKYSRLSEIPRDRLPIREKAS